MMRKPLVEMVNIHKSFGSVQALRGVDFTVGYDEVVGLIGDNGAGKSTLIKILSGIYSPDKGEIYFEGKRVSFKSHMEPMALGIETIYQDTALVDEMSIARNIFLGREPIGSMNLLDKKTMAKESMKILRDIGIHVDSPYINVKSLSGGERQSVAIARAMYFKAKLLLLDEPTSALSVKEAQGVLEFVKQSKAQGVPSVFITHSLHHVYPVADRFIVLSHGKVVGDLRKEEASIEKLTELILIS